MAQRKNETREQYLTRSRAEYARRAARAKEAGFSGYRGVRKARERGEAPGGRRQIHKSAAGTIVTTTAGGKGYGTIKSQLRAHPNARVKLRVTYRDSAGRTRESEIYSKGGRRSRDLLDAWGTADPADFILDEVVEVSPKMGGAVPVEVLSLQVVIL